jgi:LacI family transcriptional regulator
MSKATITDIAKRAEYYSGYSIASIEQSSTHQCENKEVSSRSCFEVKLQRNGIASSLRSGKTHLIGVMIPSAEINFFGSVVHGIESVANSNGYGVLLFQSNEQKDYEKKRTGKFHSSQGGRYPCIHRKRHNRLLSFF